MSLLGRLRTAPRPTPKTYLYASDSKVDSLVESLPRSVLDRFDIKTLTVGQPGIATAEFGVRHRERLRDQFSIQHFNRPRRKPFGGSWQVGKLSSPQLAPLLDPDLIGEGKIDTNRF